MNAIARYLLVFLLGWSGAVWSYSDLIYKTSKTSGKIEKPQKANDISLPDALKLSSTVTSGLNSQNIGQNPPTITPKQEQPIEEQNTGQ
ncbi:hypothetical protein M1N16_05355 [Nitrospinaceae bacterium]|nr:hypothetical protein [Nitrospinaceae bacterium]